MNQTPRMLVSTYEPRRRRPNNHAEGKLFDLLKSKGITPVKRGWPDYHFIDAAGELVIIEVKPSESHCLKHDQHILLTALAAKGIRCYKWSPYRLLRFMRDGSIREVSFTELWSVDKP